ncbi:hypothetical protein Pelo_14031 [Pelomyxa schiedti]|nr:hypothetical protein Pelo_14031 [Pelomyxa schiedti]
MKAVSVLAAVLLLVVATEAWGGNFYVYNMCDKTILLRMEITGIIYNDMALERNMEGLLGCDWVWYTIYAYEANTNKALCDTGTPVSEYCGADIIIKGNSTTGYTCH